VRGGLPWLAAALLFAALAAAFLARSLSPDGLFSPSALAGGRLLWPDPRGPAPRLASWTFETADHVSYFAPYAAFIERELSQGRLPLWNPLIGLGAPVVESIQPALVHPFTLLLGALPADDALSLLAVVRLAVAGLGAFVLARGLGCGLLPAALAGLLFMLSSFHLQFRFHPLPNVSALLPFLLWISELRLRGGSARRCGAAWSLVATLGVLGGHPETLVHTLAAAWLYHLLRAAAATPAGRRWRAVGQAALFLAACSALAALGATVVLWGQTEALLESFLLRFRLLVGPELPPRPGLPSLLPSSSSYPGILALLLAARGVFARAPFPAWPWAALAAAALLAAYRPGPVASLVDALPVVRAGLHGRAVFIADLALALLAARGLAAGDDPRARRAARAAAALLALGLAALLAPAWPPGSAAWSAISRELALPLAALAIGAISLELFGRSPRRSVWAILLLLAVFGELHAARAPGPQELPSRWPPAPAALRVAASHDPARLFVAHELLVANANMVYGVPALGAYDAMLADRTTRLLLAAGLQSSVGLGVFAPGAPAAGSRRLLDLLGVRTIATPRPLADSELAAGLELLATDPVAVYRNPGALPRAFVAEEARWVRGSEEALASLLDPRVDLAGVVVLEEPPVPAPARSASPPDAPEAASAGAEIRSYQPGDVRIVADSPRGGWLVFSEAHHRGWRARVDGRPAPVLRADYALVGVPLAPGRHEVRLLYRPAYLSIGLAISAATAAALLAAALWPAARRSGPATVAPPATAASSMESVARAAPLRIS
jgi:hypothetical protein